MQKIPATIISGFLGSGKTSLIRHILETAKGRRFAFIINEFGDLGIDRDILLGCGVENCTDDDIVELANGCICCTVAEDFLPVMQKILASDNLPEHIIIETSGLALPKPLIKAFTWPEVATRTTIDGVINVLDGKALLEGRFADDEQAVAKAREEDESLEHDNPLEELFTDQMAAADMVILNKCDLLDEDEVAALQEQLKPQLRKGCSLVTASQSCVSAEILLGLDCQAETDLESRPSHHDLEDDHEHDDFTSFIVQVPEIADMEAFTEKLKSVIIAHDILRVKGFLHCTGAKRRQVLHAAGIRISHHFDRPWGADETPTGNLVIIGFHDMDEAAIRKALS